ncbi:hypothetical protein CHARACLAT_016101 [Characodon lateralis]|uniref:Uncharacterized protein n=1 Tax=Characodon lateralis TaxID=208331 RepID=A0ABU7E3Z3_9TELE|nr:hypothetical protein [Characodon lateralis]
MSSRWRKKLWKRRFQNQENLVSIPGTEAAFGPQPADPRTASSCLLLGPAMDGEQSLNYTSKDTGKTLNPRMHSITLLSGVPAGIPMIS